MKTGFIKPSDNNSSVYVDIGDPYPGRDEIIAYYPYLQGGLTSQMAWSCGANSSFQTGLITAAAYLTSQTASQALPGVYSCSAGSLHGAKILTDGSLWTWGDATYGQTGLQITSQTSTPVKVGSGTTWRSVNCGWAHTVATKTDGSLWAWGRNNYGQLANNDATLSDLSSPLQIGAATDWKLIQAGGYHTVALKTDNTMWSWGQNTSGQLGTLDSAHRSSPVAVGSGYTWQSVAAGLGATYAIRSDGTLWAWGDNNYGQLGASLPPYYTYNSPVQVGSATNWKKVFAHGGNSACAIKTDNSAWVWGNNDWGQLGTFDTALRSSPVQLGNQNVWHSLNIGYVHAFAIKIDGSLWSWGNAINGELSRSVFGFFSASPAQVGAATNWKFVECGGDDAVLGFGWTIAVQSAADF
jgi:alpha-tubulin suppressor-like RCC1 family protein